MRHDKRRAHFGWWHWWAVRDTRLMSRRVHSMLSYFWRNDDRTRRGIHHLMKGS